MNTKTKLSGFTLIELMITLSVMAILATVAAPSFSNYLANQKVRTVTMELLGALTYARSEALKRNGTIYVRANGGDWSQGWIITGSATKSYADCQSSSTDCLRVKQPTAGLAITGPAGDLAYARSGRISGGSTTFSLCDEQASATVSERQLRVDLSGRPNIALTGSCDA